MIGDREHFSISECEKSRQKRVEVLVRRVGQSSEAEMFQSDKGKKEFCLSD